MSEKWFQWKPKEKKDEEGVVHTDTAPAQMTSHGTVIQPGESIDSIKAKMRRDAEEQRAA